MAVSGALCSVSLSNSSAFGAWLGTALSARPRRLRTAFIFVSQRRHPPCLGVDEFAPLVAATDPGALGHGQGETGVADERVQRSMHHHPRDRLPTGIDETGEHDWDLSGACRLRPLVRQFRLQAENFEIAKTFL